MPAARRKAAAFTTAGVAGVAPSLALAAFAAGRPWRTVRRATR